ncbi:MAG: TolC family protein, partial [Atribacterota bacterium]|nr:TolC family protein [Atribacterota bacterium]
MNKSIAFTRGKSFWLSIFILLIVYIFLIFSEMAYSAESLSLDIEECIRIALENNLGYRISQSKVEAKEEQVKETKGATKINAKFQGGYIRMNEAPDMENIAEGDFSYLYSSGYGVPLISVKVSKVLYSGGKLKTLVELAEAEQSIAVNELEANKQELIYKVTEAYYRVLQAEGLKRVSEQALTQIKAHLETS